MRYVFLPVPIPVNKWRKYHQAVNSLMCAFFQRITISSQLQTECYLWKMSSLCTTKIIFIYAKKVMFYPAFVRLSLTNLLTFAIDDPSINNRCSDQVTSRLYRLFVQHKHVQEKQWKIKRTKQNTVVLDDRLPSTCIMPVNVRLSSAWCVCHRGQMWREEWKTDGR